MSQNSLQQLIDYIAKLPGLGQRSGRRIALHLLQNKNLMMQLSESMNKAVEDIKICQECGNIDLCSPCNICCDQDRNNYMVCVVEGVSDLWSLERSGLFKGLYHVLGGTLSAIDGITPESLRIEKLKERVINGSIKEVIIGTNATLDGESTGHYIADLFNSADIKITRLAHGIPMGGNLEYMDEGTLTMAFKMRHNF